MLRSPSATLIALLGCTAAGLGAPRAAQASPSQQITSNAALGGTQVFNELTLKSGSALTVLPYAATSPDGGRLHIKASRIVVEVGAIISANGVGFPGRNITEAGDGGADPKGTGEAEPGSLGGGKAGTLSGLPGGGGGYVGNGASGLDKACALFAAPNTETGGAALSILMLKTFGLGSAGGAANVDALVTKGGSGGGVIILEAATIVVDGRIEARGATPNALAGVAPGAGSGGAIEIITSDLSGSGALSVQGGGGAHGTGDINKNIGENNGGGGSGGVIVLRASKKPSLLGVEFSGGVTGGCDATAGASGADGTMVLVAPTKACLDVDGDGIEAQSCGGNDCDDSDTSIAPEAYEACDGVDNDCNGQIDEGAEICPPGTRCEGKSGCQVPSGGGGSGAAEGTRPDHVGFRGGCGVAAFGLEVTSSSTSSSPSNSAPRSMRALGASLGVAFAIAAIARRKARRGGAARR